MLLTLRMEELIQTACSRGREDGGLPEDLPVLAGAHEADSVCCWYGKTRPPITHAGPARPIVSSSPPDDGPLGIYEIEGGWDEYHNSLPWDLIEHRNERDEEKYHDLLSMTKPLAPNWKPPHVKIRRRKWRCDLMEMFHDHWVANEKAIAALKP
jgi:hypothetical protein